MLYRRHRASLEVFTEIDTTYLIKHVSPSNIHSLYLMATQKMPTIAKNLDAKAKLTLYSLYKQINEKDADEVPGNKDDMP